MSKVELERIQNQLKVAVMSHQMLVSNLKNEAQNPDVEVQLHELQSQIRVLSEKQLLEWVLFVLQKLVVHQLRKEILAIGSDASSPPDGEGLSNSPSGDSLPTDLSCKPLSPAVSTNRMSPQALRRSPGCEAEDMTQRPGSAGEELIQMKDRPVVERTAENNAASVKPATTSRHPLGNVKKATDSTSNVRASQQQQQQQAELNSEQRKKLEFMTSLGLITPNSLKELQSRRTERKRKSTANPQFIYGHFEQENECQREDSCALCHRSGELLMCDVCSLVYHLHCLDPPLTEVPPGLWSCPKCQTLGKQCGGKDDWPGTLALVHSFMTHKAAREEERKKIRKKSEDLTGERRRLEEKAKLLADDVQKKNEEKKAVLERTSLALSVAERLKNLIRLFQQS